MTSSGSIIILPIMLNFRRLKQDYSPAVLKDGKALLDKEMVASSKVASLSGQKVRLKGKVLSPYDNTYNCEIEVDMASSSIIDSDCDCPNKYDCQHLAALLFHLEGHFSEMVVAFSKEEGAIDEDMGIAEKKKIEKTIEIAETESKQQKQKKYNKELLEEYIFASKVLGQSPFFTAASEQACDKAELLVIFEEKKQIEVQLALRLESRSKPFIIPNLKDFVEALRSEEPFFIGNKRFFLTPDSFDLMSKKRLRMATDFLSTGPEGGKIGTVDYDNFGLILSEVYEAQLQEGQGPLTEESETFSGIFVGSFDEPLKYSSLPARFRFSLEYLTQPAPKILLKPRVELGSETVIDPSEVTFYESARPGLIYHHTYYPFHSSIKRKHLCNLSLFHELIVPEPLFGSFVENSLPELSRIAKITNREVIEKFVTLPFVKPLKAECHLNYLNGELEASLEFAYGDIHVPAASSRLKAEQALAFITDEGILARNLTEEQSILQALFQDFIYDIGQGVFVAKNDKKIVEFMTEVIPQNSHRVKFHCPENLLEQFLYDETKFRLSLRESDKIDSFICELEVKGHLQGVSLDLLWDCLLAKKTFIEKKTGKKQNKILVLDLEKLHPIVQIFDEIGIKMLNDHAEERPLFNLVTLDPKLFAHLPIKFSMSEKLEKIQRQMQGAESLKMSPLPKEIAFQPRNYQLEGIHWLERLRQMHLGGILADDMGLGKTFQAIVAISQFIRENPHTMSLVICPTSLVYNWKEEILKFNPKLKVEVIEGIPEARKKEIETYQKGGKSKEIDILVTSYSLLQKDIETYATYTYGYAILDEAQNIKNRGTRNAKSVKQIKARHKLILTGTPIENSLEELWSLFDFLMPGLLSSFDRFIEKYIRNPAKSMAESLDNLRKKASPFILRRMKRDVLEELPPVSEIVYHCQLSDTQKELYRSYANSALEELKKLVKKEGYDKVQIHVLATLTRLKQICCHPAIFAKEKAEPADSAKYDMLLELLGTLIEGKHKTVIFSQYTKMLAIMQEDLDRMRIPYAYLDGTTKNRLSVVKKFNEDETIPVFLVSLKAGGSGLNLVGADTVIHYDMWWNPAVENQATDRVHRIGQKNSVSSYKLVTANTIEEKIVELQARKKELVQKVVTCDEEAISKLTWEEVLELLQT